jgi:hypothetical protein
MARVIGPLGLLAALAAAGGVLPTRVPEGHSGTIPAVLTLALSAESGVDTRSRPVLRELHQLGP